MEGLVKKTLHTDSAEQTGAVFGVLDKNIKELENAFGVTVRSEDSEETAGNTLIVEGNGEESVGRAAVALEYLCRMVSPGEGISEQSLHYVIDMVKDGRENELSGFSSECICVTTRGKPVKAKTAGQKKYVDAIKDNTVVFGVGPAGTGKSQIAYAVARILKLPWTTLDMSSINDAEQLTGSSRIYSNAKPGIIMEAFNMAGESNLVFIINELDKATSSNGNANPADVLLTLLDNLGFTDNYMECLIPTSGVYPIATANDKDKISAPLLSRFAVIDIPDYTREEKKTIFLKYSLPKVLKRIGLHEDECLVLDDGLDAVLDYCKDTTGIRDLEQAAEHLAAHALYMIEVEHATSVSYTADMVNELF